jgi:hypothetical protein
MSTYPKTYKKTPDAVWNKTENKNDTEPESTLEMLDELEMLDNLEMN